MAKSVILCVLFMTYSFKFLINNDIKDIIQYWDIQL